MPQSYLLTEIEALAAPGVRAFMLSGVARKGESTIVHIRNVRSQCLHEPAHDSEISYFGVEYRFSPPEAPAGPRNRDDRCN